MSNTKTIYVYAGWEGLKGPVQMGILSAQSIKGREVFSFTYDLAWIERGFSLVLDPDLGFYGGPQYIRGEKTNFGIFLDSAPDRWGKVLMQRREALRAREEERKVRTLTESDFLLGVHDLYRMGGIRFKLQLDGPFLDDDSRMTAPPMTSLRTLEQASLALEDEDAEDNPAFKEWLSLLISPGSSLGGTRPKASIVDPKGALWIAKFPSKNDTTDIGAWEAVVNKLAKKAGVRIAEGYAERFTIRQHTFLTKRFDRTITGERIHFASAMTLLGHKDGDGADTGISYLELAEFIIRYGAEPDRDLEELWRRIVFYISIKNSDDHLRNHGFLLTPKGWILSPAYDVNPVSTATGLHLNISEESNALDIDLAQDVAGEFRVNKEAAEKIIYKVTNAVGHWKEEAQRIGLSRSEMGNMERAFII